MNEIFEKKFTLTNNLYDCNDNIKPSGLLDLAQEISGNHAEILGCGYEPFIAQNYIWVIVRNYVEFIKPIKYTQYLKLRTYPLKQRFVEFPREILFYNDEDELLAVSKSIWMVLDIKNFDIATPDAFKDFDFSIAKPYFETRLRKLPVIEKAKLKFERNIVVSYSMLDHNGHMNNTKYLDLYMDVFRPAREIKTVQAEYIKQSFLDEEISLYSYSEENCDYLYAYKGDELKFYTKVTYAEAKNEN